MAVVKRELLVWVTAGGITVVPRVDGALVSEKRVSLPEASLAGLHLGLLRSLIDLAYREPGAHMEGATFYDGGAYSRKEGLRVVYVYDPLGR